MSDIGIYDYVSDIDRDTLFKYLVYSVFIISAVTFIGPTPLFLVGLVLSAVFILLLNEKRVSEISTLNGELEYKLNSLFPRPKYFHLNVNAINFFHSFAKDMREYNKQAYTDALVATDNILRLLSDMRTGISDCANHIEVAKDLKDAVLNHIESLYHSIPVVTVTMDKHRNGLEKLQLILTRIIDEMNEICMDKIRADGINLKTRFPDMYDGPRGLDAKHEDDIFYKY